MSKAPSLSKLLQHKHWPQEPDNEEEIRRLQLKLLRIQQGVWHSKARVILLLEGFDAAGKGGAIRRLTEPLDPRGFKVHPIGPPDPKDQARHYLYRFWARLPEPGTIAIFDRSWYGRVLVERVRKLVPKQRWKEAYAEILNFESTLQADGIEIVKIFLGIHHAVQLRRFEERLRDPYKQWKLTEDDVTDSARWDDYVQAADDLFRETHTRDLPWHLIPADDKDYARAEVLRTVTRELKSYRHWMETKADKKSTVNLQEALHELEQQTNP